MSAAYDTRFTIIGAGGLGGPIAYALAAAGAGQLTVCDDDTVELSNLQRQVQFTSDDLDRSKADALADELVRRGYPGERVRALRRRLSPDTADDILADTDVVVDGSDSPETKFLVNDRATAAGARFVVASALRYGGNVFAGCPGAACYRCLFEDAPAHEDAPSCAEAGVLGAAVAVVGGAAARAALALAAGRPAGLLTIYDDVRVSIEPRRVGFEPRPGCPACAAAPRGTRKEAS